MLLTAALEQEMARVHEHCDSGGDDYVTESLYPSTALRRSEVGRGRRKEGTAHWFCGTTTQQISRLALKQKNCTITATGMVRYGST
jgi:hypothetical protein